MMILDSGLLVWATLYIGYHSRQGLGQFWGNDVPIGLRAMPSWVALRSLTERTIIHCGSSETDVRRSGG